MMSAWSAESVPDAMPVPLPARHGGRRAADAMEELSFDDPAEPDDPPPAPGSPGGFRPRRRRR